MDSTNQGRQLMAKALAECKWSEQEAGEFITDVAPLLEQRGLTPEQMEGFVYLYHTAMTPPIPDKPLRLAGSDEEKLPKDFVTYQEQQERNRIAEEYLFLPINWSTIQEHHMSHRLNVEPLLANLADTDLAKLTDDGARPQLIDSLRKIYKPGHHIKGDEAVAPPSHLRLTGTGPDQEMDEGTRALLKVVEEGRLGADWAEEVSKNKGSRAKARRTGGDGEVVGR